MKENPTGLPDPSFEEASLPEDLHELGYNISELTATLRAEVFAKLAEAPDEAWAKEALCVNQPFSEEEQELLVGMISDTNVSFEVLTMDESRTTIDAENGESETEPDLHKLTETQREKLMAQVESDDYAVHYFYMQLVDSGVTSLPGDEQRDIERWWIGRLEAKLKATEIPELAQYALDNIPNLSEEETARLEEVATSEPVDEDENDN